MNKLHVKTGDTVVVLSGADKGKTGKVLEAFPKLGLVVVEGVGVHKKHQKPRRQGQRGQIIDKQMPIRASKVMEAGKHKGDKPKAKAKATKKK